MPQKSFSRLATVRQLAISTLALALGAAAALGLASCGGGEDAKLLPGNTAAEITENLDRVKQYAEEGECVGAENAVSDINSQIEGLTGLSIYQVIAVAAALIEIVTRRPSSGSGCRSIRPRSAIPLTTAAICSDGRWWIRPNFSAAMSMSRARRT